MVPRQSLLCTYGLPGFRTNGRGAPKVLKSVVPCAPFLTQEIIPHSVQWNPHCLDLFLGLHDLKLP